MTPTPTPLLTRSVRVLLLLFLLICGLYFAQPFLIPVTFAGILAMLFLPLSRRMERKGLNKAISAIVCIFLLLAAFAGIGALLAWQISDLAGDVSQMEQKITKGIDQLRDSLGKTLGVSPEKQQQIIKNQQSSGSGGIAGTIAGFMSSLMGILTNTLLVLIYIFLFLFYRTHLKKFILKLVQPDKKQEAEEIIHKASEVAQKYLQGLAMMIVALWIMYSIGFSIAGVKNAVFFAILCGLLEVIPFVGNITGTALTILMAITQGGGSQMIIGILITYGLVQFLQTYILEPLVVGSEVNINPLFTILGIVLGELLWGIPGMILAIPLMGIIKIICDHIPSLQPYGFLIGEEKKPKKKGGFIEKIKNKFS
ncbi:MAG: AI-2E family transporter [Chitinophagaceae bacterium]|nr:AI-2E family transporter [Chitinophagaceae bacterium]